MAPTSEEFTRFFTQWEPHVWRYLMWLEGDPTVIDDALQETMIAAHRYWGRVAELENVKGWLFKVAGQRLTRVRVARQRQGVSMDPHELPSIQAERDQLRQREEQLDILEAVRKLPQRQATAIALQLQYDYPLSEIAEIMGISLGSVKSHLHHARATLETLLADVDGGA